MVRLTLAAFRRQRGLYALWVLSLALAVTGLVIIDVYRQSLADMIVLQGRNILTADVALTARRQLTGDERRTFRESLPGARFSEVTEMIAMTAAGRESRLAQLRLVDDAYPLLGELRLTDRVVHGRDLAAGDAWVASDLLPLLDIKPGSTIKIGAAEFVVRGVIKKDSSQTLRFAGFAPRIYLRAEALAATKLLSFGSTFATSVFAVGPVPEKLDAKFQDPGVEVLTPKEIERGPLRILTNVLDYLGLIGLVTLSLGWVGVYYLGRRWLALERTGGALLKALGLSSLELRRLMLFKLALILIAGVALGGLVSYAGAHLAFPLLKDSLPEEFRLVWSWTSTLLLLVIGPLAGLLLLYAPLAAAADERPLRLLHATSAPLTLSTRAFAWIVVSVLGLFSLLTLLQARSWRVSGLFVASMLAAVAFIALFGLLGLRVLRAPLFARAAGWRWHLVRAQWLRRPGLAVLLVVVSALSGLLAQLVPHLERTIVGDIRPPDRNDRPSLFVFDVQDEQLDPLRDLLARNDLALSQTSPFIRARLLRVNDQDFERRNTGTWSTREEEVEARFRNRGVNLTYRAELSPSEKIVSGLAYAEMRPGDVAVEVKYAERLGLKIGDRLVFDVQGAEIPARVVALRAIDWDSFQPNFFVQFREPGELEGAPKTWILTVKRSKMAPADVQRLITADFANASSINVEETLDGITDVVTKLSRGLKIASRLAMALGVFVVLMILLFQLASSGADSAQLRVQGVRARDLWLLNLGVYGGLTVIGTSFGMLLALIANAAIAKFGFQATPRWDGASLLLIPLVTWVLAAGGLTWISVRQARGLLRDLRAL